MLPFLIIFLSSSGDFAVGQQVPDPNYKNQDGTICLPEGTATSERLKKLNRLKNRINQPQSQDIDPNASLMSFLTPGSDENRFDSSKGASIVALVVKVIPGGSGETCNCGARVKIDRDTHIELALSPDAPSTQRMICEVTPRFRKFMRDQSPSVDWSTEALNNPTTGIKGKWVRVTGWMFFDILHADESENTNPGHDNNWRATSWEIHPITKMEVLASPPSNIHPVHPSVLSAIQRTHARDFLKDPVRKNGLKAKLALFLDGLTDEEKEFSQKESNEYRQ